MPPRLTIITVVRDDPAGFRRTALSIARQDFRDFQWIVVDGGSEAETLAEIRQCEQQIAWWTSGRDKGFYDGMNKGLAKATGEWTMFMNAGDSLADAGILTSLFEPDLTTADLVYGDWIADYHTFRIYKKAGDPGSLWKGMVMCHQAMMIRTRWLLPEGFRLRYLISADYDLVTRMFLEGKHFLYLPLPIAMTEAFGVSHRKMVQSAAEHRKIFRELRRFTFSEKCFHLKQSLVLYIATGLFLLLPKRVYLRLVKTMGGKSSMPGDKFRASNSQSAE